MNISTLIVSYQTVNDSYKGNDRQVVLLDLRDKISEMLQVHSSAVQDALNFPFKNFKGFLDKVAESQALYLKHFWSDLL